jgi:hypothetical protein
MQNEEEYKNKTEKCSFPKKKQMALLMRLSLFKVMLTSFKRALDKNSGLFNLNFVSVKYKK